MQIHGGACNVGDYVDYTNIQLEINSEATEYEEYGKMPSLNFRSEVENVTGDVDVTFCNKNLLNAKIGVNILGNDGYIIKVKENTKYTLSLTQKCITLGNRPSAQHQIVYYNSKDEKIKQNSILTFTFANENEVKSGTTTITTPVGCTYIRLDLGAYWAGVGNSSTLQTLEAQFEISETATDCVKYEGQKNTLSLGTKELNGNETEKDTIVRKNNKWHFKNYFKKYTFTGQENWTSYTNATTNLLTFRLVFADIKSYTQRKLLSNCFENVVDTDAQDMQIVNRYNNYYNLECVCTEYTSVADFKAMLAQKYAAGEGIYIIYKLAEVEYEEITDTTLIAQLDALEKAYTYKTITNVTNSADAEMTLEYKKDLQLQLSEANAMILEN